MSGSVAQPKGDYPQVRAAGLAGRGAATDGDPMLRWHTRRRGVCGVCGAAAWRAVCVGRGVRCEVAWCAVCEVAAAAACAVGLAVQGRLGEQVRLAARLRRASQDRLQPRIGRLGRRGDCTGGLVPWLAGLRVTRAVEGWRWAGGGAHQHVLGVAQDRVREEDAEEHGGQRYLPPVTVTVGVERSGGR
eukprot:scaffold121206_cov60-Phaeocystis_antarctica.AAC.1